MELIIIEQCPNFIKFRKNLVFSWIFLQIVQTFKKFIILIVSGEVLINSSVVIKYVKLYNRLSSLPSKDFVDFFCEVIILRGSILMVKRVANLNMRKFLIFEGRNSNTFILCCICFLKDVVFYFEKSIQTCIFTQRALGSFHTIFEVIV
jgi:hypothetical protein